MQKKWLIIEDSNLARIPAYNIPDLQIESYPGANFRHAQAIMAKSWCPDVEVEKLVLAFRLNSRGQKAQETAVKQMQAVIRTTKSKFPYAELWIPVINFSIFLSSAEQTTLNEHIMRNFTFILALSGTEFEVERDFLHWTTATARAMLDHWASFLKLYAP